jgi:hypothetical protein
MNRLHKQLAQLGTALDNAPTETFASTLVIAGTDPYQGDQILVAGEVLEVGHKFRQEHLSTASVYAYQRIHPSDLLFKRALSEEAVDRLLASGITAVRMQSPLTCQRCNGIDLTTGNLVGQLAIEQQ